MIIFLGLAGSGKSVQSEKLAKTIGWEYVNTGQMLRSIKSPEIQAQLQAGEMIDVRKTNALIQQVADKHSDKIILDGFPREINQAEWLITQKRKIELCFVLRIPTEVTQKRLQSRQRSDDTPASIAKRLSYFESKTEPAIEYLRKNKIKIIDIDANQSIEAVHETILKTLRANNADF